MKERIGVDIGRKLSVENAVEWAISHGIKYIDCQIDVAPNELKSFDDRRCTPIREHCSKNNIKLGLHTLSSVNIAEFSPFVDVAAMII